MSPPPVARPRAAIRATYAPIRIPKVADLEEEGQEERKTRQISSRLISTQAASVRRADAARLRATEGADKECRVNVTAETEKAALDVVEVGDKTGD